MWRPAPATMLISDTVVPRHDADGMGEMPNSDTYSARGSQRYAGGGTAEKAARKRRLL